MFKNWVIAYLIMFVHILYLLAAVKIADTAGALLEHGHIRGGLLLLAITFAMIGYAIKKI